MNILQTLQIFRLLKYRYQLFQPILPRSASYQPQMEHIPVPDIRRELYDLLSCHDPPVI
jgi:hypothetical protein